MKGEYAGIIWCEP